MNTLAGYGFNTNTQANRFQNNTNFGTLGGGYARPATALSQGPAHQALLAQNAPEESNPWNTAAEWIGRGASGLELLSGHRIQQATTVLTQVGSTAEEVFHAAGDINLLEGSKSLFNRIGLAADVAQLVTDESTFGAAVELAGEKFGQAVFGLLGPAAAAVGGELSGKMYRQAVTQDIPALYEAGKGIAAEASNVTEIIGEGWGNTTAERLDYIAHTGDVIRNVAAEGPWYRQVLGEGLATGVETAGTVAALGTGAVEWAGERLGW
ncbi:MAG: hypothetical protein ACOYN0_10970 [Phycisphaerales bacterium]